MAQHLLEKGHEPGAALSRNPWGSSEGTARSLQLGCGRLGSAGDRQPRAVPQPSGPAGCDLHARQAARGGWGRPLTPAGPVRSCSCRKASPPSVPGPVSFSCVAR